MNFGKINKICVIGGGEPMVHYAKYMREKGAEVHAVLAPRHEDSELPLSGKVLGPALKSSDIPYICTDNINDAGFIKENLQSFDIAVCFGPAWVFGNDVIAAFDNKMVNFNGIPIPRYLGGAHYTWQILNDDKTSGMAIQHITEAVDLGDVLRYEEQALPDTVRIPQDYFQENYSIACAFLERFGDDLLSETEFPATPYEELQSRRLYFPRLLTMHQAYVDWSWNGSEIERFVCAFDQPYPGVSTFLQDQRVFLKSARLEPTDNPTHPFCNGLVIRQHDDTTYIAVTEGVLAVKDILNENGENIRHTLREGSRLHTPQESLDYARSYRPVIGSKKAA